MNVRSKFDGFRMFCEAINHDNHIFIGHKVEADKDGEWNGTDWDNRKPVMGQLDKENQPSAKGMKIYCEGEGFIATHLIASVGTELQGEAYKPKKSVYMIIDGIWQQILKEQLMDSSRLSFSFPPNYSIRITNKYEIS